MHHQINDPFVYVYIVLLCVASVHLLKVEQSSHFQDTTLAYEQINYPFVSAQAELS